MNHRDARHDETRAQHRPLRKTFCNKALTASEPVRSVFVKKKKTADRCSGELFILDLSNAFVNTTAFNFKVARDGCPGNTQVAALTERRRKSQTEPD